MIYLNLMTLVGSQGVIFVGYLFLSLASVRVILKEIR